MLVSVVVVFSLLESVIAVALEESSKDVRLLDPPPPAPSPKNTAPQKNNTYAASGDDTEDCAREGGNNHTSAFVAVAMESSRLAPRLDFASKNERFGSCTPLLKEMLKSHDQCQLKKLEQLEMAEFDAQHKRLFLSARLWYELFSQGSLKCPKVQAQALKEIHDILKVLRWYEAKWHLGPCQRLAKAQAEYTQSKLRGDEQRRRLEELAAAVQAYNGYALVAKQPGIAAPELLPYCAAQAAASAFAQQDGYVSKGDDLLVASMTADEGTARCATLPGCQSITFFATPEFRKDPKGTVVQVYFKEKQDVHGCKESGWQTYLRHAATQYVNRFLREQVSKK